MKQRGVREEEIQWSGLYNYLNQQAAASILSKTEILQQLCYDNIRLELTTEQIWGENGGLSFTKW